MGAPIRSIVIAGGGVDAWFVALSLRRRLPGVAIQVVEDRSAPPAPADLYAGTRPGFRATLAKLRIEEGDLAREAGGVVRLGQVYQRWTGDGGAFAHCFGRYGTRIGQAPFHQAWLRARQAGEAAPFDTYSAAIMLARAGRMVKPSEDEYSPLATFTYGWNYDPVALRAALRRLAVADGAVAVQSAVGAVELLSPHRIGHLRLADGRALTASLFVDCTGPQARLLSSLDPAGREAWGGWLRARRVEARELPASADLPPVDFARREEAGWRLQVPLLGRTLDLRLGEGGSGGTPSASTLTVDLPQGRQRNPWIGNCVALGDAAVTLEPLGAPGLHLLAQQIERLLWFLPDDDFDPIETGEYNRKLGVETDLVRNFVLLHHALAAEAGAVAPLEAPLPDALAHTLALFRARGKIPGREGEVAELDDWLAPLIGHGVMPAMLDPLLDTVSRRDFAETDVAIRALIAQAVAAAPTHRAFLDTLS